MDDVQDHLQSEGLVDGSSTWPSVRRQEVDDKGESGRLVIIMEDGGPTPEIPASAGIGDSALGEPGVQVRVRGAPHESDEAEAQCQAIIDELHGKLNATIGSTLYHRIMAQTTEPVWAGYDEDDRRPNFTASFLMLRDV